MSGTGAHGARPRTARGRLAAALAGLALLLAPGCIVLHDAAGVDVPRDAVDGIEPGRTTRGELLARLGPPTGRFSTDLLAAITRVTAPIELPATPGRLDDDVLTWQSLQVRAHVVFVPVLFLWVDAEYTSRTLTVWFDGEGRVLHAAWREDRP